MVALPSGTVTFLFTDIEGSTRRWEDDPGLMQATPREHHGILTRTIAAAGGCIFKTVGDAICAAFADPTAALVTAVTAQQSLVRADWDTADPPRVRMAVHTGVAVPSD